MANTYTLISSNVLSSAAASVTFSSIPATYTDLVLRISARNDGAVNNNNLGIRVNGLSTTIYSSTYLQGSGSAASSSNSSGDNALQANLTQGSLTLANTFTSLEFYFSNYAGSNNKPVSGISQGESNVTSAVTRATANLIQTTSAITSILIYEVGSYNFVSGSSFYLYGIKNS